MKIDKKKIVFVSIIAALLLFITAYTLLVTGKEEVPQLLDQPVIPQLEEVPPTYGSRLEALRDLKEEREIRIPDIYPDTFIDSSGSPEPELPVEIPIIGDTFPEAEPKLARYGDTEPKGTETEDTEMVPVSIEEMAVTHEKFFLTGPLSAGTSEKVEGFKACVNGSQTLRSRDRIELLLIEPARINGAWYPDNSLVYGAVTLKPNRVLISISHIENDPVTLEAYDLQDGQKGIYVRNGIRAQAGKQVLGDLVREVDIPGIPSIGGLKNLFRRNNARQKVTIMDHYQLILKPKS